MANINKIKKCTGKEGFQRINFLYQAANAFATENATSNIASSLYSNLLVNVSRKTVQRIDINMKRTMCKGCRSLLLAGVTCKVRVKKKKVIWTCITCRTSKVFDVRNKNYKPWTQREESVVDILDYTPLESSPSEIDNKHNVKN